MQQKQKYLKDYVMFMVENILYQSFPSISYVVQYISRQGNTSCKYDENMARWV